MTWIPAFAGMTIISVSITNVTRRLFRPRPPGIVQPAIVLAGESQTSASGRRRRNATRNRSGIKDREIWATLESAAHGSRCCGHRWGKSLR